MAWERGTNEYFCLPCVTIFWRLNWKLPKDKVKMKSTYLSLKRVILILRFWFPFPKKWTIINDYKYIYLTLWESRHLEEFSMSVLLLKSLLPRRSLFRDLGSPVSRQLLQLQLFPNFLKFWTLLVEFVFPTLLPVWIV